MNSHRLVFTRFGLLRNIPALTSFILALTASAIAQSSSSNPYFGQTVPRSGAAPVIFAPGIASTSGRTEERPAFSPDGKECFFGVTGPADNANYGVSFQILRSTLGSDGSWTTPVVAEFSGVSWDASPVFSADGRRLYFISRRPYAGQVGSSSNGNIWYVEKTAGTWSQPQLLSRALIRTNDIGYVSVSASGNVYFLEYTVRGSHHTIFRSRYVNGEYQAPEDLNAALSSSANYLNDPFISSDESFLVFNRGVPGNMKRAVSFHQSDDTWTVPVLIENQLAGAGMPYMWAMCLTPDMKYLFFTGQANTSEANLYWLSTDLIRALSPAPQITVQPHAHVVNTGRSVSLAVQAAGITPLSYQWYKDGSAIAGATGASLNLASVTGADAGSYTVTITNTGGSATSSPATITIGTPSRLSALAVRTESGPGADVLIVGVVVSDTPANERKQVIVRGVGPGLQQSGISNFLTDPEASVYSGANLIAYNNDWDYATLQPALAAVGLDNLSRGSKDAAMLAQFSDGGYSVQVGSRTTGSGVALAEIYESDSTTQSHMSALAVRAKAGTNEQTLICGFVIKGVYNKRLVIRGLGPALASSLGSGYLTDPKLDLYSGSTIIASNDNWGNTPELLDAFTSVSLLPMEANSRDAAMIVDLPPGGYSVFLTGVANTTGVGLIEIYELP